MKTLYFLLSVILTTGFYSNAQIAIVPAQNGTSLDTSFITLDDIVLYETMAADFSGSFMGGKLALLAPEGFEFDIGSVIYHYSSKPLAIYDIFDAFADGDAIQSFYGNRVIVIGFEFHDNPVPKLGDTLTISGLKVRAVDLSPKQGKITRTMTANDALLPGIIEDSTSFGQLSTTGIIGINYHKNSPVKRVKIYPQPISEYATIEISNGALTTPATFSVYNLLGELMVTFIVNNREKLILKREALVSTGIYFYQFATGSKVVETGKLVVN